MKRGFLTIALLLVAAMALAQQSIELATGEFEPWTGMALPHGGFTNHVVSEAFAKAGYEVKFHYWPWKRSLESARQGLVVQGTSYWACTEQRQQDFICSNAVSYEEYVFFHQITQPVEWNKLEDLQGLRIGATRSYAYTPEFWKLAKTGTLNVKVLNNDQQNFTRLLKGQIDLFPISRVAGYRILTTRFDPAIAAKVTFNPKALLKLDGTLLFPKSRPESQTLVEAFNQGLAELKKQGTYDKLYDELLEGKYLAQ